MRAVPSADQWSFPAPPHIGHTKFITMIETPDAFFRIREIVAGSPRNVACNIGGEDFALNCNMQPTGEALFYPKQHMIFAANAQGEMFVIESQGPWNGCCSLKHLKPGARVNLEVDLIARYVERMLSTMVPAR